MQENLLDKKELFESFAGKAENISSFLAFQHIFLFKDFFDFTFDVVDDNLCVFAKDTAGMFAYFPPLGESISAHAVEACFVKMKEFNLSHKVSRIDNVSGQSLKCFAADRYNIEAKGYEYLYFLSSVAGLRGNLYKSKRADYNVFARRKDYSLVSYKKGMRKDCVMLDRSWREEKAKTNAEEMFNYLLEDHEKVLNVALDFYDELELFGKVVLVNNKIEAFSFGYEISKDVFCVALEIANPSIDGLATFIFSEVAKELLSRGYAFVNAMDDSGLKNIAFAKELFRPDIMLNNYVVREKIYE